MRVQTRSKASGEGGVLSPCPGDLGGDCLRNLPVEVTEAGRAALWSIRVIRGFLQQKALWAGHIVLGASHT